MKKFYIAIFLILLCISFGIYEMYAVDRIVDECYSSYQRVDSSLKNKDYLSAYNESMKNAKNYEKKITGIMFCYFNHKDLENLNWNMYQGAEYIKHKQIGDYQALKITTKKQLQSLKDEELFEIQNIL